MFWTKSKDDLKTFHLILNHLNPNLSFTMEKSEEKLPFLDILLLKNNSTILTDIYSKETDSKQYLNFHSCHPKHTKTSIPYNLARRICTIVSDQDTQKRRLSELRTSLQKRNYPDTLITEGFKNATSIPRNILLTTTEKKTEDILPYVSTYEGGSICNENPFITPSPSALGFYAMYQTKDQSIAFIMVQETLFYLSKFNKLQTF